MGRYACDIAGFVALGMPPARSVLFVASECAHFVKAGGLGDVVAALPAALRAIGHDARVVMPRYDVIAGQGLTRHAVPLGVPLGPRDAWSGVLETRLPGTDVPVYLLEHDALFGRGYLYDPPGGSAHDNLIRFAFLCRGALQLCKYLAFVPDVFHVHDWPTALLPVYLNTIEAKGPLARVTTVSPRYAHEIRTPEGGAGLDSVTRFRGGDLVGVLNGIDEKVWDPRSDPAIAAP